MFTNNCNLKEVQKYQSNFSHQGKMRSPFKTEKQNLTTLARLFNPNSYVGNGCNPGSRQGDVEQRAKRRAGKGLFLAKHGVDHTSLL